MQWATIWKRITSDPISSHECLLLFTPCCCGECFAFIICRGLCACTEMLWMCVLYVNLGWVVMGSVVLFVLSPRLLLYSAGSEVNRVQVDLSVFSVRLLCFVQTKTLCRYGSMYVLAELVLVCGYVMMMSCVRYDLNRFFGSFSFLIPFISLFQVSLIRKLNLFIDLTGLLQKSAGVRPVGWAVQRKRCITYCGTNDVVNGRPDPGFVVKQCPRIVMNKIFDWHWYNRFSIALSLPLRIDSEFGTNELLALAVWSSLFL